MAEDNKGSGDKHGVLESAINDLKVAQQIQASKQDQLSADVSKLVDKMNSLMEVVAADRLSLTTAVERQEARAGTLSTASMLKFGGFCVGAIGLAIAFFQTSRAEIVNAVNRHEVQISANSSAVMESKTIAQTNAISISAVSDAMATRISRIEERLDEQQDRLNLNGFSRQDSQTMQSWLNRELDRMWSEIRRGDGREE